MPSGHPLARDIAHVRCHGGSGRSFAGAFLVFGFEVKRKLHRISPEVTGKSGKGLVSAYAGAGYEAGLSRIRLGNHYVRVTRLHGGHHGGEDAADRPEPAVKAQLSNEDCPFS